MLEINDLVKEYGNFRAVNHLELTVGEKQIFGFVGPNGAGKTTVMKIMSGLLRPTAGTVQINGIDVSQNPRALKTQIGYMPDFFGVYDNLKVDEYMDFYAGAYDIPYRDRKGIIANLLEIVNLTDKKEAYVDALSRGMKQRLCLARSLVHDPKLLILDEPASGLDPRARVEMKEVLKQLKSLGKTIIISSHILTELAEMSTIIGIINKGKMVAQGSISDITKLMNARRRMSLKNLGKTEELVVLLKEQPDVTDVSENAAHIEFSFSGDDPAIAQLIKEIVARDIPIVSIKENEGNLEEIFMQLTEGGGSE
ncbi:MAG: ABC transporter ATP-binding protein [Clostridiales bacterium]|jgi:ABC-2 type transport system ATP-binding protein|nr:ABC transporter ATP-binding protein [Clostridiales bacterium]